jgi:hypothetical protein
VTFPTDPAGEAAARAGFLRPPRPAAASALKSRDDPHTVMSPAPVWTERAHRCKKVWQARTGMERNDWPPLKLVGRRTDGALIIPQNGKS